MTSSDTTYLTYPFTPRAFVPQIRYPDTAFGGEADAGRPLVDGFVIKVFALLHSRFEEVGGA